MNHLMCGRGMLAQLHFELELIGSKRPAIMHLARDRRKALRAARLLSKVDSRSVPVCRNDVPADCDFLILAGGRALADMTAHDVRRRALVPLAVSDLDGLGEPLADFLVLDASFISAGSHLDDFFNSFCRYLAPETGEGGFRHFVSGPAGRRLPTFRFSAKTKVYAGDSALNQLPHILREKQIHRPLLMTDAGIVSAGLLETVQSYMGDRDVEVFDGIPQDSSLSTVNDISRIYRDTGRDGLIALGGGSVLDTGKGVYLNVSTGTDDLSIWAGSDIIPELKVPFIAIPTTSGTGSEMTKAAVISNPLIKRKMLFISANLAPDEAVLDSRLTATLPPHITSITGMDALSHSVEAYTCLGKNPISDRLAYRAIELLRDHLEPCLSDPGNLTHRRALAMASNMAGTAFSNSMVGMVHTIGHSVGAICHIPHGACMSVFLPAALEYNFSVIEPLLSELYPALVDTGGAAAEPLANLNTSERAHGTIRAIRKWNSRLKEATYGRHPGGLDDLNVDVKHYDEIARTALGDASIAYNPVELRYQDILDVLGRCR